MLEQFDPAAAALSRKLKAARRRAGFTLLTERLAAHFWRGFVWVAFFAALWLFQLPEHGGKFFRISSFLIFLCGLVCLHYKDMRFFRWPRRAEIDRRIEEDSQLEHRPLGTLSDALANSDKIDSRDLWLKNKKRAMEKLENLKPVRARRLVDDPYMLRLVVTVFLVAGLFFAGHDGPRRVWRGLTPFDAYGGKKSDNVRIVLTPPAYTGLKSLVLSRAQEKKQIEIPAGSKLKATAHGGFGTPYLTAGGVSLPFTPAGPHDFILEMTVPEAARLSVSQFWIPRAAWNYKLIPDTPPVITMKDAPEILPDGSIRFSMTAEDDYGVKTLSMRMELGDISVPLTVGKPVSETRSIMSPAKTPVGLRPVYDLTAHPWAGLPVKFTFEAEDGGGLQTLSAPIAITLPERTFENPVAKLLVGLRKKLFSAPRGPYDDTRAELEELIGNPQIFQGDLKIALALRAASSELYWGDKDVDTASDVAALLWDIALKLEDGDFPVAKKNLLNAQQALEDALKNPNMTGAQISELMQNLRGAMADYFTQLAREMQKRAAEGKPLPVLPPEAMAKILDPDSLSSMLSQMEAEMNSGDRDSARKLLSQLQDMTDMLNSSSSGAMPKDAQEMMDGIKGLDELIARQKALLGKTKDSAALEDGGVARSFGQPLPPDENLMKNWGLKDMPPPPQEQQAAPAVDTKSQEDEQEGIRKTLGDIMLKAGGVLDQIPEGMGQAEQEMRGSSKALADNHPVESAPHQEQAIEDLEQGQKQLQQKLAARLKEMTGLALGGMKYDPLGRAYGDTSSTVKIPDEAQRKQAQEIQHLIQQKSGELERPDSELDYFRRLLRQF